MMRHRLCLVTAQISTSCPDIEVSKSRLVILVVIPDAIATAPFTFNDQNHCVLVNLDRTSHAFRDFSNEKQQGWFAAAPMAKHARR